MFGVGPARGEGKPFLRDHAQRDSMARGGTLIESGVEVPTEGHYEIRQVARLTEPWAIALYLRGNMTTVSIGWIPTGPVLCSVCNAPVGEKCGGWWKHWPGDRLKKITDDDGNEVYVDSNKGSIVVRWIYTAAELIETSCVPVPGVPTAEMDQLRATLSAQFPAQFAIDAVSDEESQLAQHSAPKSPPSAPARSVDPTTELATENPMADQQPDQTPKLASLRKALAAALTLPEEHRAHGAALAASDIDGAEAFCLEGPTVREASVKAALDADPIVFTGALTKRTVRRSEGAGMLSMARELEASASKIRDHEAQLAAQQSEREAANVAGICSSQLASMPGTDDTHRFIVGALHKSGGTPEQIDAAIKSLAMASTNIAKMARAPGLNDERDPAEDGLEAELQSLVAQHAKDHKVDERTARLAVVKTERGRALYNEIEAQRKRGGRA